VFGVDLNLQKSSLLALQLHTLMDPVSDMEPVYQQLPDLRQVPLVTKGTVVVGVPIGTKDFVDDAIRKVLSDCAQEFQKLTRFPFANCFILLLRYCCNQKLMYLMRNVSPTIMLQHAHHFDNMIQSLFAQYFHINLTSNSVLEDIVPGSRLDAAQIIQLANFQIRDAEERGGFGLKSMASITIPAFTAATFCHIFSTIPLLLQDQPILTRNASSDLFTSPILAAHTQMVAMGALTLDLSHPRQPDSALPQPLALPEVNILFDPSTQAKNFLLSKPLRQLARQDTITQWAQLHSPILQHVQKVIQADDSLRARLSHLSQCEIKGPHKRFDIPPDKVLRFRPTAFIGNMHSMVSLEFSSVQLGQLFQLLLGLEFPPPNTSNGLCFCGRANDTSGYHRLNCSQNAGKTWVHGHNLVVSALGFESRRLGLSVVDIDAAMRKLCTHPNSLARGDILVRSNDLEIKDCAAGHGYARKQFVIDVKTVALVDGNGDWGERWNSRTGQHDNPGMLAAEQTKYRKHELAYSHTGYSFVAFICSCFGALGPSAIRYLSVLAMLELRQYEALRNQQGLDPLDESERAQYRARCFKSSSARIAAAMAKATVMRLAGTPSLPAVAPVPRQHRAHNQRGAADFADLRRAPQQAPQGPSQAPRVPSSSSSPLPPPTPPHSRAPPFPPPLDLRVPPPDDIPSSDRLPSF
jgi:hypothetical protein